MSENHVPVMLNEVIDCLEIRPGQVIVDATFGFGGHGYRVAEKLGKNGRLIGFERDIDVFQRDSVEKKIANVELINDNFTHLRENLEKLGIEKVDAVYFDLGISTYHYHHSGRGFSFSKDEPLDMRLSQDLDVSASDLVNGLSERELADLFYVLAQEFKSRQIAKAIVDYRRKKKIKSSGELAEIIAQVVKRRGKIHPATKVFQALRMAVNDELDNLRDGLAAAVNVLKIGGRVLIITFHSGEDRVVKHFLKDEAREGRVEILTKKPIVPERQECIENPPSRSAKIRVARRI